MNIRKWVPFLLLELIAFLHLLRILLGVDVVIDGDVVPMYVSIGAIVLFGWAGWLVLSDARPSESGS